tara:strand:+ start:103 stop:876 length:774 start_codon:yes stop_codon:yes gene_type:complete
MKPQKPRVSIDVDSTFVTIHWNAIPNASYYTVKYTLGSDDKIINTLNVTTCSAVLTSLYPDTEYVIYVNTTVITQLSQYTTLKFRTLSSNIMDNKGSGVGLYPSDFSHMYDLAQTTLGYRFDPNLNSLYVNGNFFQFCCFDLGVVKNKPHIDLQLQGASGDWKTDSERNCNFDNTLLQIKIDGHTGWMNANCLRVPGVQDKEDGARVFDNIVSEEWNSIRVTLSSVTTPNGSWQGTLYVRIGLSKYEQSICGVKILS